MTPADLSARYQSLLTCSLLIDTRDHLPLFHSLPGRVLEIGCDVGNSTTAFLAGAAESVTSIDVNPQCAGNFPGIDKWRFILGDSQQYDTYAEVADHRYDVLYVDGAHDYASAFHDIATYSDLVKHRGVILVHDVLCPDTFPGVWKAFRDFDDPARRYGTPHAKYILPGSYGLGVIEL
jgi:predicted O-methyltransferase YrrM